MIAIPIGLVRPATDAGIPVPDDLENWDESKYIRWTVFCNMQLGASMPSPGCHWDNAKIIAALTDEELTTITPRQLVEEKGFAIGNSYS